VSTSRNRPLVSYRSYAAQDLSLFRPFQRERRGVFQHFGSKRSGLGSITYALDDLGREQHQRDQALYITILHTFSLGDLSDGSGSS
jgi:hypothetical protein